MMKRINILLVLFSLILLCGCRQDDPEGVYYPFKNHVWERFNILKFEVPAKPSDKPYSVILYARFSKDFPYRSLDFNMIMTTPSGEERIREFQLPVKDDKERFLEPCAMDICETTLVLKKEIYINKEGFLVVELENLIPRMETPGLLGIGIRLQQN